MPSLIQEDIFCYIWEHEKNEIRMIASWDTPKEDVERVRSVLQKCADAHRR